MSSLSDLLLQVHITVGAEPSLDHDPQQAKFNSVLSITSVSSTAAQSCVSSMFLFTLYAKIMGTPTTWNPQATMGQVNTRVNTARAVFWMCLTDVFMCLFMYIIMF